MRKVFFLVFVIALAFHSFGQSPIPETLLAKAQLLCQQNAQLQSRTIACIVDFSRPSYEKRLWIVDLNTQICLLNTWVAHGRGTGRTAEAKIFSNKTGSYCSSLGLFLPKEHFSGKHGLSLRLAGLEPGINDQAEARGIIFHAASYVNVYNATINKRQGNSQGCFVVAEAEIKNLVELLENTNAFIWATQ